MVNTRPAMRRSGRTFAVLVSAWLILGSMTISHASAVTPTFRAVGSAKQVYVTGVAPNASMSLIARAGNTLATQRANSLGGVLFRNVPPATGYRVRRVSDGVQSEALTVHSEQAAPWDPEI